MRPPGLAFARAAATIVVALGLGLAACTPAASSGPTLASYFAPDPGVQAGGVKMIPIHTPKGDFKVWTKRFGKNPRIKLLLLHGGPGATHEYFEALETQLAGEGIEFIYYDQLGSTFSDQPTDPSLWTIDRFVDEVEQVRVALGLDKDNFYLLGHSWGGILAVEYALRHGDHLKGLIISNMMMSIPDYNTYAETVLAKQMDPAVYAEIKAIEARKDTENPRYMALLMPNFYQQHLLRLREWPAAAERALGHINRQIYVLMQGPSEFGASGLLENWDRKADLPRLAMPTLVIGAAHDTMDPAHMRWVSTQVQHGSFLLCPDGGHLAMWDDQQTYVHGLVQFLKAIDQGAQRVAL
jgi:proline iminopeptidase